ncbi:MAG: SigE family polymerase sigma factor [Frankiales bacterium]|nr:SigE family polymerase sigma factor [Frankiales bacterium]
MLTTTTQARPAGRHGAVTQEAFDAFYADRAPALVRQLHAQTGDLGEAQDCVQEAFARAWQRWDRLAQYDVPEAWVRQVAWRLAVSRFRRAGSAARALRRHGPPPDVPAVSADRVALVAALARVPAAQRRAVVLHHVAGLSVQEVAEETGVPVGTVKARLSRGRTALAALLSEETS